jgi:branched-chain amino acid transport system substrate-binding protein
MSAKIAWRAVVLSVVAGLPVLAGVDPPSSIDNAAEAAQGEIVLGMSTTLTGPAEELGVQVRDGVELCLAEINAGGGIRGRQLRLVVYDDGYEPARTVENVRRLIDHDQVLAIIGNVGTPTAVAALPLVNDRHVLLFAPYSGAAVLRREPPDRYVINFRPSYAEEAKAIVGYLVRQRGISLDRIGLLTQSDAFGDAGYAACVQALRHFGLADHASIPHGRYRRNTLDVEGGLAALLDTQPVPEAVILIGAYAPAVRFIRLSRSVGYDPVFCGLSVSGPEAVIESLGDEGDGVIFSQVVPHPGGESVMAKRYQAARRHHGAAWASSFSSFEAYVSAHMLVEGMRRLEGPLTREALITSLEAFGRHDMGLGCTLTLSPADHQASHEVWITVSTDGEIIELGKAGAGARQDVMTPVAVDPQPGRGGQ